jgi:hypothetical protein
MTDQRALDRLLDAFFVEGTNELADRVIDGALDQIDHTPQRRAMRLPRRFQSTPMLTRLAAAAVIGALAVGAALYLVRPPSGVGTSSPTPGASASPGEPAATPTLQPSTIGPMAAARQVHTATMLDDGRVLVAGGYGNRDEQLASAELYDPVTSTFSLTGPLAEARGSHTATLLADGRVLIAGGGPASWLNASTEYLTSAELYDPTTGTFSPTGSMTTPRDGHTATALLDGRILMAGGNDLGDHGVASAELYDPETGTFTATGSMTTARGLHTATLLSDGRVLIVGGDPAAWTFTGPYLASAEVYDPATGTFTATGSMAEGRELHAATVLSDGRVLISGGVTESLHPTSLDSAELYDPTTGTFSPTGPMTGGRVFQTASLLSDGRVLIAGGLANGRVYANNPTFLATAEIYDPATGTFAATGSMADMRSYHTATVLADGRVLVAAGAVDAGVTTLPSAEIYDPATGTFSPVGPGR